MSLINDALKKAQRDREASQRESAAQIAPGGDPKSEARQFKLGLWAIGLFGALAISAFSVWLTLRILRSEPAQVRPVEPAAIASAPKSAPTATPAATPSPTPAAILVAVPTPRPPTTTPTPGISPEAERARIQGMVNRLRISGIRISDKGNRALINDRLIRPGDLLDAESGLRILVIAEDHLEFVDNAGRPYSRSK